MEKDLTTEKIRKKCDNTFNLVNAAIQMAIQIPDDYDLGPSQNRALRVLDQILTGDVQITCDE